MPWSDRGRFWVGHHATHGLIVFDKSRNASDSETLTVYYVREDRFAVVKRDIMRQHISAAVITKADVADAVDTYLTYEERELQKKHTAFLKRAGKAPAGLRPRSERLPPRATHCYSCQELLSSEVDFECVACGWILCNCGACGCGYER